MSAFGAADSPVDIYDRLGNELGVELLVKRDDLLPFPLAGNKVRKLFAEAEQNAWAPGDVLITNGGVESNHCRTLALMAARLGAHAHLVMHGVPGKEQPALRLLESAGATYDVVLVDEIAQAIEDRVAEHSRMGRTVRVIPGGAHTKAGVESYVDVGYETIREWEPAHVVVASGTGATHAGLHIAGDRLGVPVTGVSIARRGERGIAAVREAVGWVAPECAPSIRFDDRFTDGGYGVTSTSTTDTVALAWRHGLPVDGTYTGKALRGLIAMVGEQAIAPRDRVLFWHTGGLMNHLVSL